MSASKKRRTKRQCGKSMATILGAVFSGGLVGVSLLTFPGGVLLMVAVWLVLHSLLALWGKPGWMPLLACLAILLIKRTPWLPGFTFMLVVLAIVGLLRWAGQHKGRGLSGPLHKAALAIVWLAWLIAVLDSRESVHSSRRPEFDPQRPVVCLGDSLTAYGYPDALATRLSVPVVNMGRDGISTTDALEVLPQIRKLRPQAVIVELGGHDYLREHGQDTCSRNLQTIVEQCRAVGAEVVLVEIPRGIVIDPFAGLERRLARHDDLELISDTTFRWFFLFGPYAPPGRWLPPQWHLSDDGLHPNDRGNQLLASRVRDALVRLFGPEMKQ